jgi:XTP/dITP diphosphohydrolase
VIGQKRRIVYVTSSDFKKMECQIFLEHGKLDDGTLVSDLVHFEFREKPVLQILEVDIEKMVRAGVVNAYREIKVPCIVEYAGLVLEKYLSKTYPGGLSKAMWNAFGNDFLSETYMSSQRAIARAVIAFCDGKQIHAFTGETKGTLADSPRGDRQFYWDTVFIPDKDEGGDGVSTYSEIVADPDRGLQFKMDKLSQSAKAIRKFADFLRQQSKCGLWN